MPLSTAALPSARLGAGTLLWQQGAKPLPSLLGATRSCQALFPNHGWALPLPYLRTSTDPCV